MLALFCKAGMNRSIACGRIASHVFSRLGYNVQNVIWLAWPKIERRLKCTGNCSNCRLGVYQSPVKTAALERAFRLWNRL